jgi:hypothetical protein
MSKDAKLAVYLIGAAIIATIVTAVMGALS